MDKQFLSELHKADPMLFLWLDPVRKRWVVMRQGERYGPSRERSSHEVAMARSNGAVAEILVCQDNDGAPIYPSWWILDYLRQRDSRRFNVKQFIQEMDERNRLSKEKIAQERSDRFAYQVKANWNHLKDELSGDTSFRKYTITKP